jgi:Na+/H+ antiporter NhaA
MQAKQLVVAGLVAGIGLTVALFVSGQAFVDPGIQGAAKMGALLSGGIAGVAILVGRLVNVRGAELPRGAWFRVWRLLPAGRQVSSSAS